MTRERKLFRHTLMYAVGNFGSKALNIILLPFYTNMLSQAEYGTIEIVLISLILLAPIVSVNMGEAVFRFSVDNKYKKEQVLNIGILATFVGAAAICCCLPIINIYFDDFALLLSFSFLLFIFVLQSVLKQYARALEKLNLYMFSDFAQVIFFVVFVVLFIGEYEMGVYGFIYAKIIALSGDAILLFFGTRAAKALSFGFNYAYAREMFFFGVPLIPNSLMWWVSNASDRYMLASMVGVGSVGLYSVATKFPIILAQISTVFFKSWQTSAIDQDSAKDSNKYYTKIYNGYAAVLFLLSSVILIFIKPLMSVLVSTEFFGAWIYTPFLLLGAVFSALAGFLGINYNVAKDTRKALFSTGTAATVNIILNILLIPYFEIMGASIATLVAFFILLGIRIYETPRYKNIQFDFRLQGSLLMIFILHTVTLFYFSANSYIYYLIQVGLFGFSVFSCRKIFIKRHVK